MKKQQIIGYCLTRSLHLITEQDAKMLDVIHVAFGLVNDLGEVYWDKSSNPNQFERLHNINPNLKIMLSVGGWEADGFSQAAATKLGREKFAASLVNLTKVEGFDGIDIDWEYPCSDSAGIHCSPDDKENFTLLLAEIRKQLDQFEDYKTLAIAAGSLESYIQGTNMKDAAQYLDYVQLMTYDYHCGLTDVAGHLANLYPSKSDLTAPDAHTIIGRFVEEGVPIEKIVMGCAFYGRQWDQIESSGTGLGDPTTKASDIARSYTNIEHVLKTGEEGFVRYWDEDAKACYLFNGSSFVTYEDKEALKLKVEYVKNNNMYGIMYWEYTQDENHELTTYLWDCLNK